MIPAHIETLGLSLSRYSVVQDSALWIYWRRSFYCCSSLNRPPFKRHHIKSCDQSKVALLILLSGQRSAVQPIVVNIGNLQASTFKFNNLIFFYLWKEFFSFLPVAFESSATCCHLFRCSATPTALSSLTLTSRAAIHSEKNNNSLFASLTGMFHPSWSKWIFIWLHFIEYLSATMGFIRTVSHMSWGLVLKAETGPRTCSAHFDVNQKYLWIWAHPVFDPYITLWCR